VRDLRFLPAVEMTERLTRRCFDIATQSVAGEDEEGVLPGYCSRSTS
jgi:hypothetical protein